MHVLSATTCLSGVSSCIAALMNDTAGTTFGAGEILVHSHRELISCTFLTLNEGFSHVVLYQWCPLDLGVISPTHRLPN